MTPPNGPNGPNRPPKSPRSRRGGSGAAGGGEASGAQPAAPEPEISQSSLADRLHRTVIHWVTPGIGTDQAEQLRDLIERTVKALEEPAPYGALPEEPEQAAEEVVETVRRLIGTAALAYRLAGDGLRERSRIEAYVAALEEAERRALLEAAIRAHLGLHSPTGTELIRAHLEHLLPTPQEETAPMPNDDFYKIDTSSVDVDEQSFVGAVNDAITNLGIPADAEQSLRAGIVGMLLLDGNTDTTTAAFSQQITTRLWNYVQSPLVDSNGARIAGKTNRDVFVAVDGVIRAIRGAGGSAYYQELATAARQIIDAQRGSIIVDKDGILLASAVQVALQNYASGARGIGSFVLPPLTGPSTGGGIDEIIPYHVQAVGVHFAAYQLEVAGFWQALQRSLEIFMNGQLPVSADMAGNALNAYYWDQVNQLSESARWMQYTRVLGVPGGELAKEVQPNGGLIPAFSAFISSLSEYDRQQRVADMLGSSRGLNLTGEHVRKAGRDLAANATLYGYGFTQFAAKKLQTQIQTALNIYKLADFQAAWGVQSAWQAIQRIMSQEFQKTPNIVKQRTLAESGMKVFDLVAKNSSAWSAVSDLPLFQINNVGNGNMAAALGNNAQQSDISETDRQQFMRHAEYILAVQGTSDADVVAGASPKDTPAIASIPSMDGSSNGHNADIAGQIQQMLNQNQTPSPDQLRKLIGV